MKKKLTVSIAAYQVEKYIRKTLSSFIEDGIRDQVEVLIIDDGGHDGTLRIAKEYAARYPDTFFPIHKENGGWGSTVNCGIENAHGDYFKLLDGDDYFDSGELRKLLECLSREPADLIYTPYRSFDDKSGKTNYIRWCDGPDPDENKAISLNNFDGYLPLAMHSICVKKKLLSENKVSLIEHCFYSDVEYSIKVFYYAENILFLNATVYNYREGLSSQSVSLNGERKHYREHLKVLYRSMDFLKQHQPTGNKKKLLQGRLKEMVENQYQMMLHLTPTKEHKIEFIEYDSELKKKYSEYYDIRRKTVRYLRMFHFIPYGMAARYSIKKVEQ